MKKIGVLLVATSILFFVSTSICAAEWITVEESPTAKFLVDTDTLKFSGEETDPQMEVWIKSYYQHEAGGYMVADYVIKERGLSFMMKERTSYSASDQVVNKFTSSSEKWTATTPSTPVGAIATKLFANYKKNSGVVKPEELGVPTQNDSSDKPKIDSEQVVVDPAEFKNALEDKKIKNGVKKDGTKWFYVRDTWSTYHLLDREHMSADFWLIITGQNTRYTRFNFTFSDARAGSHTVKQSVRILVDGKEWVLDQRVDPGETSLPTAMFEYSFLIPDSLMQALLVTKDGVTVKWEHSWGGWNNYEYTIPAKTVRNIQMMYAGCK
jgi:hypothetical protein